MRPMKPESAEDRFWRRERLYGKYEGVKKGTIVIRGGRLRPARSEQYLANVAERFQQRLTAKLSKSYYKFARSQALRDKLLSRLTEMNSDPAVSYIQKLKTSIELAKIELEKAEGEKDWLLTKMKEQLKGNILFVPDKENRVDQLLENIENIKKSISILEKNLRGQNKVVLQQYEKVRKLLKNDKEYMHLRELAKGYRANYRRVNWILKAKALQERELLEAGLVEPKKAKQDEMLRGYRLTQQALNMEEADKNVLLRYTKFLSGHQAMFAELGKIISSLIARKYQNIALNKHYLAQYEKWWYERKEGE